MTTIEKIARRKLSLLDLASDLGNVSKACKVMGYSRQHFYEIRRNFQTYGADGLVNRLPLWLTVLVISRDVVIVGVVAVVNLAVGPKTFTPSRLGKWATAVFILTTIIVMYCESP